MNHYDPIDINAQEKAKAENDKRKQVALFDEAEDIKWVMSNKRGRRMVWGLLELTGVYRSSFTGNSETFFREGQRNVGLRLLALLHEHCPEKYTLMITEQQRDERSNTTGNRGNDH